MQYKNDRMVAEVTDKEEALKAGVQRHDKLKRDHEDELENLKDYFHKKLQSAIEDQQIAHEKVIDSMQRALNDHKNKRSEIENKILVLGQELERRDREIKQYTEDISSLRQQLTTMEKNKNNELEDLKNHYEHRKRADVRELDIRLSAEKSAFETQALQLQQKLEELQQNAEALYRENIELKGRLGDRNRELEQLRVRESSNTMSRNQEVDDLRKQLEQSKRLYRVIESYGD